MIITKNFLSLFNPEIKGLDDNELIDSLLLSGIEIEKSEKIKSPDGIFYGIIKDFSKVEGSSKLNLCKVEIPYLKQIVEIVCGADNVRKEMKVVVALPGAILSNGEVTISKRKIFGVESNGMICSYSELYKSSILTNSESFRGKILDLGKSFKVNRKYSPKDLGLDDFIMDLLIPINRGDLTTAFGLAKEIQKLFNLSPEKFNYFFSELSSENFPWEYKRILFTNNVIYRGENPFAPLLYWQDFCTISFEFDKTIHDKPPSIFNDLYRANRLFWKFNSIKAFSLFGNIIEINLKELSDILGIFEVQVRENISYLEKYDYKFANGKVIVPSYRDDLKNQKDFAEELTRLPKFKKLDENKLRISYLSLAKIENEHINNIQKIKEFWRNRGFFECSTFNLTNPEYFPDGIHIDNPQSKSRSVLRKHALYELIDVVGKNSRRKNILRPVFEVFYSSLKNTWILNIVVPEIDNTFALNDTYFSNDLLDLLSLLCKCFECLEVKLKYKQVSPDLDKKPFCSENLIKVGYVSNFPISKSRQNLNLETQKGIFVPLGYMGYLESCLPFKLWGCMIYLQDLQECWSSSPHHRFRVLNASPSLYPISKRDISIFIPDNFSKLLSEPIKKIRKIGKLIELEILEKYQVDGGNKYLLRCHFQSKEKTLTKEEINGYMNEIYEYLKSENIKVY